MSFAVEKRKQAVLKELNTQIHNRMQTGPASSRKKRESISVRIPDVPLAVVEAILAPHTDVSNQEVRLPHTMPLGGGGH